ncbi:hypothetical protein WA016_01452 [Myxococcus stipitatus]
MGCGSDTGYEGNEVPPRKSPAPAIELRGCVKNTRQYKGMTHEVRGDFTREHRGISGGH